MSAQLRHRRDRRPGWGVSTSADVALARAISATAVVTALLLALMAAPVLAADAPHIAMDPDSGSCAICHRSHTAASETTWTIQAGPAEAAASALIIGTWDDEGDTMLCYACHGVDSLGSNTEVQAAFVSESAHPLAPESGDYGPQPMDCSSCHDSHGTDHDGADLPFPSLLRSMSETSPGDAVYSGDAYCATCHLNDRILSVWDGLEIWEQTAHSTEITAPASGTGIVCSVCHDSHGSNNPPLITEELTPPAVAETTTVPANDRQLCFVCHETSSATYVGATVYETSTHAQSEATVTVSADWASDEQTRTVGECQTCHVAMGASDGAGGVVPKLVAASGSELCERCHNAELEIAPDLARFEFPDDEAPALELAVAWSAEHLGNVLDRLSVWTQETTGTAPRDIIGPRVFDLPGSATDAVNGDIDGDGTAEVIVADSSAKRIVVLEPDELAGFGTVSYSIDATPTYIAVGDLFLDGSGLPEIAVVARSEDTSATSSLYVYRYSTVGPSLTRIVGPLSLGDDASGIAAGHVRGTVQDDLAVTCIGDDTLRIFTESTVLSDTFVASSYNTRKDPRGPSIGDAINAAGTEIVVANAGETAGTISVFSGAGTLLGSYDATATAGAVAYDTLVADVLPSVTGNETIVALRIDLGTSAVNVFQSGAALGTRQSYTTGAYYNTATLASGDVDSDGKTELVVGNAGRWAFTTAYETAPTVQVFSPVAAGNALSATPVELSSEGVELAGGDPSPVVLDLGGFGESRHPVGMAEGAHVSTETPPFAARHVECADCHNVHETTSTVPPAGAPDVYGQLAGVWGVSLVNGPAAGAITYTEKQGVDYEYEVCFKCHSGWSLTPFSTGDIASQVDTRNPSLHAIESSDSNSMATSGSFVTTSPALGNSTVLYCTDCHGNSDGSEALGPHSSESAALLRAPYRGVTPDTGAYLCYTCHKYGVYVTGADDDGPSSDGSNFYDTTLSENRLHKAHVGDCGFSCGTCHVSHGSRVDVHLIRTELVWTHTDNGGACYTPCHGGSTANAYSRVTNEDSASSVNVSTGTLVSGDVTSVQTVNSTYLQVAEVTGVPGFDVRFTFTSVAATPGSFRLTGRYAGSSADDVYVEAYDQVGTTWVRLAALPYSSTDDTYVYPLGESRFVSGGGQVDVRVYHQSSGTTSHNLYVDRVWLRR